MRKVLKYVMILLLVSVSVILLNDIVRIPLKNNKYLDSCELIEFISSTNASDSYIDGFGKCIKRKRDFDQLKTCWEIYSAESISIPESIKNCPKSLYDNQKILLK